MEVLDRENYRRRLLDGDQECCPGGVGKGPAADPIGRASGFDAPNVTVVNDQPRTTGKRRASRHYDVDSPIITVVGGNNQSRKRENSSTITLVGGNVQFRKSGAEGNGKSATCGDGAGKKSAACGVEGDVKPGNGKSETAEDGGNAKSDTEDGESGKSETEEDGDSEESASVGDGDVGKSGTDEDADSGKSGSDEDAECHESGAAGDEKSGKEEFRCTLCKVTTTGKFDLKCHFAGKKHKATVALMKGHSPPSPKRQKVVATRCDLCNMDCQSSASLKTHLQGKRHRGMLKTKQAAKKPGYGTWR